MNLIDLRGVMENLLKTLGVGPRPINDSYFDETYRISKIFQRQGVIINDEEELCHEQIKKFSCHESTCGAVFHNIFEFEMHYNSCHRYVCSECKAARPTPRLLDIHIEETHDVFFGVLSKKQPMYQCFVSECDLKFNDPNQRREHCEDVHKFPKHYRFDETHQSKAPKKKQGKKSARP